MVRWEGGGDNLNAKYIPLQTLELELYCKDFSSGNFETEQIQNENQMITLTAVSLRISFFNLSRKMGRQDASSGWILSPNQNKSTTHSKERVFR